MLQSVNFTLQENFTMNDTCTVMGHAGETYGFTSMNGFFPQLNYSMSIISNQDWDLLYPFNAFCRINSIVMKHMGRTDWHTVGCVPPLPPKWTCVK